ncbi:MAG: hypothetical protein AAB225_28055 [Acidobacteriota bacterium]
MILERNQPAIDRAMQLAGCYVVVSDVPNPQLGVSGVNYFSRSTTTRIPDAFPPSSFPYPRAGGAA